MTYRYFTDIVSLARTSLSSLLVIICMHFVSLSLSLSRSLSLSPNQIIKLLFISLLLILVLLCVSVLSDGAEQDDAGDLLEAGAEMAV